MSHNTPHLDVFGEHLIRRLNLRINKIAARSLAGSGLIWERDSDSRTRFAAAPPTRHSARGWIIDDMQSCGAWSAPLGCPFMQSTSHTSIFAPPLVLFSPRAPLPWRRSTRKKHIHNNKPLRPRPLLIFFFHMAVSIMRLGVVNYHSEAESSSLAGAGRRLTTAMHHSIRNPFSAIWLCGRRTTCREKMTPPAQHQPLTWTRGVVFRVRCIALYNCRQLI